MNTPQNENEPIKSQQEANDVQKFLVETTMKTLGISSEEAERRIRALFKCGILVGGSFDNKQTQFFIDFFLRIASELYTKIDTLKKFA